MRQTKALGYACALLATLIWSGNFIVARGLGDSLPPITLAALRWTTATVVLLPWVIQIMWRERSAIVRHKYYIMISAFLAVTIFNTLIYYAAHTTDALNMTLIATTTPAFVVILSRIFLGEPISRVRLIGLMAAITGIVILVTRGDVSVLMALSFRIGDLWMLLAGLIWAIYSILIKKKPRDISQYSYLGTTFLVGVLPLIPAAIIEQTWAPHWTVTPTIIGSVLYIGIGASLISYFLWTRAVEIVGPTTASFVYYSLPAFSGIEAYFLLGETMTWAHGIGFVLICGGIVLATNRRFAG